VNLPLVGLALNFGAFMPLALASLALSFGTCALAAVQAELPRHKRRFWSRPLIALLFAFQPMVRGWARFKWRANLRSQQPSTVEPPIPTRVADAPDLIAYWSAAGLDRLQFLHEIVARLERAGCVFRNDTGWTSYDLEMLPNVWTRLRLTTVSEELESGKKNFRCRIAARWSLPARICFAFLGVGVVLAIFLFAQAFPWIWFALLIPAMLCWFFADECLAHRVRCAALIGEVAERRKLVRLESA
jgi:hypothetical protein